MHFSLSPEPDWDHGPVWCVTDVGAWPTFTSTKWGHWSTDCRCYPLSSSHGLSSNQSWTIAFSTRSTRARRLLALDRLAKCTETLRPKQTVCPGCTPEHGPRERYSSELVTMRLNEEQLYFRARYISESFTRESQAHLYAISKNQ